MYSLQELEAENKSIMPLLFFHMSFGLHCQGVFDTEARKDCISIFYVSGDGSGHEDSGKRDNMDAATAQ
jgi:hypothetical protein